MNLNVFLVAKKKLDFCYELTYYMFSLSYADTSLVTVSMYLVLCRHISVFTDLI